MGNAPERAGWKLAAPAACRGAGVTGGGRWAEAADGEERQHLQWRIHVGKIHSLALARWGGRRRCPRMNRRLQFGGRVGLEVGVQREEAGVRC